MPVRGKVGDLASIYSFNGTGTLIWQLLDTPRTLAELIDAVEHEYAVAHEKAQNDVKQFLNDMLSVELVAVQSVAAAESDMADIDMNATNSKPADRARNISHELNIWPDQREIGTTNLRSLQRGPAPEASRQARAHASFD